MIVFVFPLMFDTKHPSLCIVMDYVSIFYIIHYRHGLTRE